MSGRWLVAPALFANLIVAAMAALFLHFVAVDRLDVRFWVSACITAGVWLTVSDRLMLRRARPLETPEARLDALHGFSDSAGRLSAVLWVVALLALAVFLELTQRTSTHFITRLVATAFFFGPIAWMLVTLLTAPRVLMAIEESAKGVLVPLRPTKRANQTRFRLVLFTLLMAVVPALMLADIARSATLRLAHRADAHVQLGLILGAMSLVFFTVALVAAWAAASGIADPLRRVADEATAVSRGELGATTHIAGDAEVGLITAVFSRMKHRLLDVTTQLRRAGQQIDSATASLHTTARRSEISSADQASALSDTSATTESLARSARNISANAAEVQNLARQTLDAAEAGRARAHAFQASVERMKQDNRSISTAVEHLQQRVLQIGTIVEFINGVADRSDLLALSAELEGTRAGEVGRGFALVAAEMRRLAENVLESTAEVEELIAEIREATRQTALATEVSSTLTNGSTALATEVAASLTTVADLARETSNAVRAISLATQQQVTSTDLLAEAMGDILGLTQQGLATTQQLTVANEQLRTLSMNLSSVVERFA